MDLHGIKISAYRGDEDEPYRLYRLHAMLGALAALCGLPTHELSSIGLKAVDDHKGNLSTAWSSFEAAAKHAKNVERAWAFMGEEGMPVRCHVQIFGHEVAFLYDGHCLERLDLFPDLFLFANQTLFQHQTKE